MQKLIIVVVAVLVIGVLARVAIGFLSANRVATGLIISDTGVATLAGCDGLQNCTASTATGKRNLVEDFKHNSPASEVIAKFSSVIDAQPGTQIITQQAHYLHATFKTTLLGYTDDLELLLDQSTGVLHVRSASRIGKSDLGANRKRIETLRELAKTI